MGHRGSARCRGDLHGRVSKCVFETDGARRRTHRPAPGATPTVQSLRTFGTFRTSGTFGTIGTFGTRTFGTPGTFGTFGTFGGAPMTLDNFDAVIPVICVSLA